MGVDGLAPQAFIVDGEIYYPSGAVAERAIESFRYDSGTCINVGTGFAGANAEMKRTPVSSLGLSGAFHLAR
jgi:hypothetical protein